MVKTFLHDISDIGEYGAPNRVGTLTEWGPGQTAPVASPSRRP